MRTIRKITNFLIILSFFLIILCLLSPVNASDLSNDVINENINDNIINNIEYENQNCEPEIISKSIEAEKLSSSNIYISPDGDDSSGDGSASKPYKTIKKGIESSASESTIFLSQGNFEALNLTVDKTLTIQGEKDKTVIDGKKQSRLFFMTSNAKLTLIGLTLANGNLDNEEEGLGGSIYNDGGELTIIDCTIKDSYASYNGGAIYNNLGKLTIRDSNIINNTAVQYGGAIYSLGTTNVENTYLSLNHITAEKGVGGAIACGGTASFTNDLFERNYAIYSAGAILSLANTTINNCRFINQSTQYTGGTISNHNYMVINNSQFIDGYARFYAAAILAPPSGQHVVTEVYNTIFENNHVTNHAAVSNNFKDTELKMENCAIVNNYILSDTGQKYYGDVALDDNASLLYCWWGQNEVGNYYSPHNDDWEAWKIDASKWLIMTFTSSNGIVEQDKNNILTVSLHQYFDNETKQIYDFNKDINLPLTVRFYTSTGKEIKNVTMENGIATLNYVPELNVRYIYAQLNNQILNISVKMKEESNLIADDLTKTYNDKTDLSIKLTDANNSPLANKKISISLDGKTYEKLTDSSGNAKLNINLLPGTYKALITFIDGDYRNQEKTIKITVLKIKTSFVAKNLVKYYKNATKLTVKLQDSNKKAMKSKTVKIKIAGKTISAKTNSKGIATFKINNKAGTYSVKISFNGDKIYQKSTKTIKVYVKSAKMTVKSKKIRRKSNFVATFKDKDGKVIKNTKVKFKLKGKTYIRSTNKKGQAKFKVNVKRGSYNVKASFKSTKLYGASVFTTKIKVIK